MILPYATSLSHSLLTPIMIRIRLEMHISDIILDNSYVAVKKIVEFSESSGAL
jgi:hypothetical protein